MVINDSCFTPIFLFQIPAIFEPLGNFFVRRWSVQNYHFGISEHKLVAGWRTLSGVTARSIPGEWDTFYNDFVGIRLLAPASLVPVHGYDCMYVSHPSLAILQSQADQKTTSYT